MKDKPPRSVAGHTQVGKLGGVVGHCTTDGKNLSINVPSLDKRKTGQTCIDDYQDTGWVIDRLIGQGHHAWLASHADVCEHWDVASRVDWSLWWPMVPDGHCVVIMP
jgi:hypothetical protein